MAEMAGGGSAAFSRHFAGVDNRTILSMKTGKNPLNLTKSKRSRIGFKVG